MSHSCVCCSGNATPESAVHMQVTGGFDSSHFPETAGSPSLCEHKAVYDKAFQQSYSCRCCFGNATSESTVHMRVIGGYGLFVIAKIACDRPSLGEHQAVYNKTIYGAGLKRRLMTLRDKQP